MIAPDLSARRLDCMNRFAHSRVIPATLVLCTLSVALSGIAARAIAGSATRSTFGGVGVSSQVSATDSITLLVHDTTVVRVLHDTIPTGGVMNSRNPAVFNIATMDSFCFVWAESTAVSQQWNICRRIIGIDAITPVFHNKLVVYPAAEEKVCYLFAHPGLHNYCVSFQESTFGRVRSANDDVDYVIDNSSGLFHSMTWMRADTFVVATSNALERMIVRKISSSGLAIEEKARDTVMLDNAGGGRILNTAVAVDPSGLILALYTRKVTTTSLSVRGIILDADLTPRDTLDLFSSIGSGNTSNLTYYPDAPAAAVADNVFAVAVWTPSAC